MNIYERIKEAITVPQAARRYGLKVGRNGMVNCLFHDDRHPSMKLNEWYYAIYQDIPPEVVAMYSKRGKKVKRTAVRERYFIYSSGTDHKES